MLAALAQIHLNNSLAFANQAQKPRANNPNIEEILDDLQMRVMQPMACSPHIRFPVWNVCRVGPRKGGKEGHQTQARHDALSRWQQLQRD